MNQHNRLYPERRQHIRIVTLRNFAWCTMVFLLVFAAISLRSELRGRHMHDYGRLTPRQVVQEKVEQQPVEVVSEAAPSAPVQSLAPQMTIAEQSTIVTTPTVAPAAMQAPVRGDARVAIVGGPEGVSIVRQERPRPMLRGGFGRP
jgi:hypothetical protein